MTRLLVPLLTAVLLALTPPSVPPARSGTPELPAIKIAVHGPLTGGQAALAEGMRNGVQLAVDRLGGSVADRGYRLEVASFDDQAKPGVAVDTARQRIVKDADVLLVIGHLNSTVSIPASEVYRESALAMISPASSDPRLTERGFENVFRVIGRDDVQGAAGAEFAVGDLGAATAFVLHDRTDYGQRVAEAFRAHAGRAGLRIVGLQGVEEGAGLEAALRTVRAAAPDLVYFAGIFGDAGAFFRQARAGGLTVKFLGPDGLGSPELVRVAGEAAVGLHYTTLVAPASVYPGTAGFVEEYRVKFRRGPEPFAAQAYDAAAIGLAAIERSLRTAGGRRPTREQVTAEIRRTRDHAGLTGTYAFTARGDPAQASYFLYRILSANPGRWGENRLVRTRLLPPPAVTR